MASSLSNLPDLLSAGSTSWTRSVAATMDKFWVPAEAATQPYGWQVVGQATRRRVESL